VTNKNAGIESPSEYSPILSEEVKDRGQTVSTLKATRRNRHSFYLDTATVRDLDQAFKRTYHELHPREISKSDFLEECMRYALSHLNEITCNLGHNE